MRTLQAGGLTLEPQTAAHAPEMFVLLSDPVLCEYLDSGPPSDVAWLTERFSRLETRRSGDGLEHWLNWVLRVPGQGLVGFVQATVHADGSAHVAYELDRAFWGRGWATQATSAMVQELADHYAVQRAFATVDKRNIRSIRLLERLGFTVASADSGSPHAAGEGDWLYRRDPLFAAPTAAP